MKVYPQKKAEKKEWDGELSMMDSITRRVALAIAFVSVFIFFIKLLFL